MIKCNISKEKNLVRVKANGTPYELALEVSALIEDSYKSLGVENENAAAEFKNTILALLLAPNSPVWNNNTQTEQPSQNG